MDPRAFNRKGYDTDLLILRTLFALNPNTNLPISSFYVATTDGIGGLYWLSAVDYISAATGIANLPSTLRTLSTGLSTTNGNFSNFSSYVSTVIIQGLSSLSTAIGNGSLPGSITAFQLNSTVIGLGSVNYISSLSLQSTVNGLGSIGYLSTPSLVSTIQGLGSASYISTTALANYVASSLVSTVSWLTFAERYISAGNLLSTSSDLLSKIENLNLGSNISSVFVYGTLNLSNVSIGVLNYTPQDISTLSTSVGVQIEGLSSALYENAVGYALSTNLFSSLAGLGTLGYLSTASLISSLDGLGTLGYLSSGAVTSTTLGLGNLGYVSSSSLASTVAGLGLAGYVSTLSLISTVEGLGTASYISSVGATQTALNSTLNGLGNLGYVSTLSLLSTVAGLGSATYLSSVGATQGVLNSTIDGLGTFQFLSTVSLTSSLLGLGTAGYISSTQFLSSFSNILSSSNYISTGNLQSTTVALQKSFYIVNNTNVYVTGGVTLNISTNSNIIYLSSFLYSTITYKGENGNLNALLSADPVYNSNLLFSTANLQLDLFSSYITNKSIITIDAYPSLFFTQLAYSLDPSYPLRPMNISSFIQYGGINFLSSQMSQTMIYPTVSANSASNIFNQPIRITIPGSLITNIYSQKPFFLSHYVPNAVSLSSSNGFSNKNVSCYFGSTNSVFLSVQNLPS